MNTLPAIRSIILCVAIMTSACALAGTPSGGKGTVFRWVDEHGTVHYGDQVPPQYADQDKIVLNSQGVQIGAIPGRRTPEQWQAESEQRAAEDKARQTVTQARVRDQNLLATYLSVEEIEALRDRRAEIVEGQARVTTQYIQQLRARQSQLEQQALHFKPYNTAENAVQMPERLAEDLVRTTTDIATQQRNLDAKRQELDRMKTQFGSDIARFRELKRIEIDYARGAPVAPRSY